MQMPSETVTWFNCHVIQYSYYFVCGKFNGMKPLFSLTLKHMNLKAGVIAIDKLW